LWVSVKFCTCTVVCVNETLLEAKICTFALESTHFIFSKCPIYNHDGASANFSISWDETDHSVLAATAGCNTTAAATTNRTGTTTVAAAMTTESTIGIVIQRPQKRAIRRRGSV
jgi:hypothetical protein